MIQIVTTPHVKLEDVSGMHITTPVVATFHCVPNMRIP